MRGKAERRPRPGEIGFAVTEYDRVKVDSILIDQAEFGETFRQGRTGNLDLALAFGFQRSNRSLEVIPNEGGVRADRLQ